MVTKFTRKEHVARAMLLGRVYDWRDGTYCYPMFGRDEAMLSSEGMLDCDTCEVIRHDDAHAEFLYADRRSDVKSLGISDDSEHPCRPWEAEDGV